MDLRKERLWAFNKTVQPVIMARIYSRGDAIEDGPIRSILGTLKTGSSFARITVINRVGVIRGDIKPVIINEEPSLITDYR